MGWKAIGVAILSGFLTVGVRVSTAQVASPAQMGGGLPLAVGVGFSNYDVDWGHGRMYGGTFWIDYAFKHGPELFHGLGLEVEARDISLNRSATQPPNYRLDTIGGGLIYTMSVSRIPKLCPYGKFNLFYGGIDWNNPDPQFTHETRTVAAPGLGFQYKVHGPISARVDYEYQFWPDIALMSPGSHILDPQGFTFGVMYDLRGRDNRSQPTW